MISVLFVCTGNICRSPSAEGVFAALVDEKGLSERFHIDSAGTHGYHIGEPADTRSAETALNRGYDISAHRARRIEDGDYKKYDYILVMDQRNYQVLLKECPDDHLDKVRMFLEFAPHVPETEVPDPYYGGDDGFEHVLNLVEEAAEGLLGHILEEHAHLFEKAS